MKTRKAKKENKVGVVNSIVIGDRKYQQWQWNKKLTIFWFGSRCKFDIGCILDELGNFFALGMLLEHPHYGFEGSLPCGRAVHHRTGFREVEFL